MIETFNSLPKLALLFLFIAFSCSNRPKVETIFKDRLNFVSIKVKESKYNSSDVDQCVKYGQRRKAITELYRVKNGVKY